MSKTITIPEPPKSVADASAPDVRRAKRVLVVEGDGVTRWILLNSLRSVGLLVDFAPNSSIALYKFRHRSPDAILLDVQLRGNSGLDLIKAVRKDAKFSRKPIYIFTRANTMGRSVRKVVSVEAAKVFDKATTVPEWLAASIAKELTSSDKAHGESAGKADTNVSCTKEELQAMVADLCVQGRNLEQSKEVNQGIAVCKDLRERAAVIVSSAGQAGMGNVARQAEALESLLDLICNSPKNLDETSFTAVFLGTQTLEALGQDPVVEAPTQFAAVVVDETASSRTAVSDALADAGFVPTTFAAPAQALEYLARNPADAIVTVGAGLSARGMDPSKIKKLSRHQNTPVLAVPSLAALNGTADTPFRFSDTSDANPIALMKLVLKALNLVQKAIKPGKASPATIPPSPKAITVPPTAPAPPALPALPSAPTPPAQELKPKAPAFDPSAAQPSGSPEDGKLILFIEDDPIVLKAYGDRLQREGFQVVTAMDGLAALDMLLTIRPQAIVLDLMLPKLHGLEVLKFIRSDSNLRATPVVVLSNVYMGALSEKAMEAGANLGMPKTQCSPNKLIKVIRKLISGEAAGLDQEARHSQPEVPESHPEDSALAMARAELLADGPKEVVKMREDCLAYIRTAGNQESMDHLTNLYRGVRFLGGRAGLIGCTNVNDLTVAFEAVLFEIVFKASEPTASVLQTIAQAVDCLGRVFENGRLIFGESHPKYKVLVVDDDAVFNYTTTAALKRANLEVVATQDPVSGLQLLPAHRFDLVLLDINMPEMDGFAFCAELRRVPDYLTTPVVFVTMHAEFQNRARSLLVGGNDMIGKPVSPLELALKVTIRLLDSGLPKEAQSPTATGTEATLTMDTQTNGQEADQSESAAAASEGEVMPAPRHETDLTASVEQAETASAEFSAATGRGLPETESEPVMAFQPASDSQESLQPAEAAAPAVVAAPDDQSPEESPVTRAEPATDQEVIAKLKQDRETLVMRTYAVETELHNAKNRIERRDKAIKLLQQKLEEFTAQQSTIEESLAEPDESLEQAKTRVELADEALKGRESVSLPGSTQDPTSVGREWIQRGDQHREDQPAAQENRAEAAKQAEDLRQQLKALIQAREEMSARLTKELEVSSESAKRIQDLERQLSEQTAALNRTETEARQQAEELRHQLVATMALEKQAEARAEQLQARCGQLEKDLAVLTQACDELNGRFTKEQQAAVESAKRVQELEQQLAQNTTALDSAKAEATKQTEDLRQQVKTLAQAQEELNGRFTKEQQAASESAKRIQELENQLGQRAAALDHTETQARQQAEELRHQLVATAAVQKQAESRGEQLEARCRQLEQDLAATTQAREQLHTQFVTKEQSASASTKRIQELEQQLAHSASALGSIRAEAAKQADEWHQQLVKTEAAQKQAETKGEQLQARCEQLEQNLGAVSQAREQLHTQFITKEQSASASTKRIQELERQLAQSANAQGNLKAEAAKQAEDLRQQLAAATQAREELNGRLAKEQQLASASANRFQELEKQLGLRTLEAKQQEAELRHRVTETSAARKQAEAKAEQLQARCGQLENELTASTQAREELNGRLNKEQHAASESAKHIQELEKRLGQQKAATKQQTEELLHELMTTTAARKQAETKGEQLQTRCGQLEKDLTTSTQAREELNGRLAKEQQAASESAKRVQGLEQQLAQSATALNSAKAEATKQTEDLRHQLAASTKSCEEINGRLAKEQQAATTSAKRVQDLEQQLAQSATALNNAKAEATKQTEDLRHQLATSTKRCEELNGRLAKEQQAAAASAKRVQDLEQQLAQSATALNNAKAEATKQTEDLRHQLATSTRSCEELNGRLAKEQEAASESAKRAQNLEKQLVQRTAALGSAKAEAARQAKDLGQQLTGMNQAREELNGRLAKEQQIASASAKRIQELEQQLAQSATALGSAQAEAAKQAEDLRHQVTTLTQTREELNGRLTKEQQAASASANRVQDLEQQLAQTTTALGNAKAEAIKQTEDLRSHLAASSKAREELSGLLTREQQVAAASANRIQELEKQLGLRTLEAKQQEAALHQQLAETSANQKQAEAKGEQLQVRCGQLEKDLVVLNQVRDELSGRFANEQKLSQESGRRTQELEKQLSQSSMALEHAQAAALQQAAELRQQLADTSAAQKHAEARGEQFLTRCGQLEKDLTTSTQAREELGARLAQEQQVSAEAAKRIQELEKQQRSSEMAFRTEMAEMEHRVRQAVESLTRATADLEKERVERKRIEDHAASLAGRMQELHEELSRHLAGERAAQQRIGKLEVNLRQRDEAANRLLAQLQQKLADHQLAEEQLREAKQREDQLQKNVILFEQARKIYKETQQDLESKFVASLNALRESDASVQKEAGERRQLAIALEATRQNLVEEAHKRQNAESQFDGVLKRLTEIQTRLQNETSERQRLAEALETSQRDLRDQAQRNELELSKLQSVLQLEGVEHKRLETQVMRLHRVSLDSARTGRVYRSNVRRKIAEPVEELCQSARRLLQLDLNPEQNQLVRSVLEKALLVQANLVDGAPSPAENGVGDSAPASENGSAPPAETQAPPTANGS